MDSFTYDRQKGRCLRYEIWFDHHGYEIRQDGELKKKGRLPQAIDQLPVSIDVRRQQAKMLAESDIDGLVGMDE